ncbi:MAG: hypothetical protein KDC44_04975 [Phaeodactylibacter sp.]|nr:hypothetical protein [Phaeodactylibacter sp.]
MRSSHLAIFHPVIQLVARADAGVGWLMPQLGAGGQACHRFRRRGVPSRLAGRMPPGLRRARLRYGIRTLLGARRIIVNPL